MAKFIKSIFTPDKRKSMHYEDELEGETESPPPLDDRRKLSMSRSGRLKQSYKRRQQLSVDVYGGEDLHETEKPKSMEYHVNRPATPTTKELKIVSQRNSLDSKIEPSENDVNSEQNGSKSPEEEIDNAFEIIDKS